MRDPLYPKIESRIPDFIKSEYPAAHKLIVDFYKWLEEDENFIRVLTEFRSGQEVNNQIEPYIDYIISELGWIINRPITISKSALVASLRDFYLSRGSENSFKYLFRVLFGEEASISYPRDRLFTLSNANYNIDHWILTSATNLGSGIFDKIAGGDSLSVLITGQKSGTSLPIERVVPIIYDGKQYLKLMVNKTDLDFKPNETVIISNGEYSVFETIFACTKLIIKNPGNSYKPGDIISVKGSSIKGFAKVKNTHGGNISSVSIVNPGTGYVVGDHIKTSFTEKGWGFFATVSEVGSKGEILNVKIWSPGYDYVDIPSLIIQSLKGNGATIVAHSENIGGIKTIDIIDQYWKFDTQNPSAEIHSIAGNGAEIAVDISGCISRDTSSYKNSNGFLETNCIIHDSDYFQNYSYEVHSRVASAYFNDALDDLLHPVGYKRYNVYLNELTIKFPQISGFSEIIIIKNLMQPTLFMQPYQSYLYDLASIEQTRKSTIFSINNIEMLKFSTNLTYQNSDFGTLSTQFFSVRHDTVESRTIDPEISIATTK
jgi:hypothetical protein